jgi:hypothetical protein
MGTCRGLGGSTNAVDDEEGMAGADAVALCDSALDADVDICAGGAETAVGCVDVDSELHLLSKISSCASTS